MALPLQREPSDLTLQRSSEPLFPSCRNLPAILQMLRLHVSLVPYGAIYPAELAGPFPVGFAFLEKGQPNHQR